MPEELKALLAIDDPAFDRLHGTLDRVACHLLSQPGSSRKVIVAALLEVALDFTVIDRNIDYVRALNVLHAMLDAPTFAAARDANRPALETDRRLS